jgi:hypothetical protein
MKKTIEGAIIALGVGALAYGISKMAAETTTMILPVWLVIAVVSLVVCAASMGIGLLVKYSLRSKWHPLTFASMVLIIVVAIYSAVEFKPTLNIIVSSGYAGEVRLFVARDNVERRDIAVNSFGIGYITMKDFEKGFYPKIMKGQRDISKDIHEYSKGASLNSLSNTYSFKYLAFVVPGQPNQTVNDIDSLLRVGGIDTGRLPRK